MEPLERLRVQILRAEAHFKSLKSPYQASSGQLQQWRICYGDKPLVECAAAVRIQAVYEFGALRGAILSDAGLAARRLAEHLDIWEQLPQS